MSDQVDDPRKRQMLKGILGTIQQPDPGGEAAAALSDEAIAEAIEKMPDDDKRRMVQGIVAVMATAGLMITLDSKEAKADISMSEVRDAVRQALQSVLGPLIRVLMAAFGSQVGFAIPASIVQMIELLLEWLNATDQTVIQTDPTIPIGDSWPEEPPIPDVEKREAARFTSAATRARAIQSSGMFYATTSQQAAATAEEQAIVAVAAADTSVLTKLNANNALLAALCGRVGHLSMSSAAHGQLSVHDTMRAAHEVESTQQLMERFVGAIEDLLASNEQLINRMHAALPPRQDTYLG
jgi:hypothetical protein